MAESGVGIRAAVLRLRQLRAGLLLRFAPDVVSLAWLLTAAIVIERDFLTDGDYLPLTFGDWIAHAYRTRFVQEHGIATWDHNWSGGLAPFQAYQFLPHVVTGWLADLSNASIGRTMLAIEGVLIIWVRVSGYATARALGLRPVSALIAGVVTFGMNTYASDILSYSSLWGVAVVPVLVIVAFRYSNRPAIYPVAAGVGLCVFLHPLTALAGVAILLAAFVKEPMRAERLTRLGTQGLLVALASSFYWLPTLVSDKPAVQDPTSADVEFLQGILDRGIENFSDVLWIYVPAVSFLFLLVWRQVNAVLLRFVAAYVLMVIFLIGASYAGVGPETVRLMQSVRLYTMLPLGLGLLGAIAVDAWLNEMEGSRAPRWAPPAAALLTALLLAVPLVRFADGQEHRPVSYKPDPIDAWLERDADEIEGRVWFDDLGTALYAFEHFDEVSTAMSHYPVGDWSLVSRPLQEGILLSGVEVATTEDYLKAMAVSHVALPLSSPFALKLAAEGSPSGEYLGITQDDEANVAVYQTPWRPVEAFYTSASTLPPIDVPREKYVTEEQRAERDQLVAAYVDLAYSDEATPVEITNPSATTMRVVLEDLRPGQYLLLSENWDGAWRAETESGQGLDVEAYGPSYVGVDVSELSGDQVIEFRHVATNAWKVGLAFTLLSFPAAIAALLIERRR